MFQSKILKLFGKKKELLDYKTHGQKNFQNIECVLIYTAV